jgi:hypothetical protein
VHVTPVLRPPDGGGGSSGSSLPSPTPFPVTPTPEGLHSRTQSYTDSHDDYSHDDEQHESKNGGSWKKKKKKDSLPFPIYIAPPLEGGGVGRGLRGATVGGEKKRELLKVDDDDDRACDDDGLLLRGIAAGSKVMRELDLFGHLGGGGDGGGEFDVGSLPSAYGPRTTETLIDALFNPVVVVGSVPAKAKNPFVWYMHEGEEEQEQEEGGGEEGGEEGEEGEEKVGGWAPWELDEPSALDEPPRDRSRTVSSSRQSSGGSSASASSFVSAVESLTSSSPQGDQKQTADAEDRRSVRFASDDRSPSHTEEAVVAVVVVDDENGGETVVAAGGGQQQEREGVKKREKWWRRLHSTSLRTGTPSSVSVP